MNVWLAGMTCLTCGQGRYGDGYTKDGVLPCDKCGAQAPASLPQPEFRERVKARDEALPESGKTVCGGEAQDCICPHCM